ncbi:Hsp20/alpha crystallin family protein [Paenibacillus abyssi]|uniref:Heat-shock protein Hsp20 n=1 Tax=Paenibacillus abyssi TaxID=1340531 RepID=A0A917CTT1_9BACL|nr:Hsp20/alpha crystallin family protein [Paenibacillus abyssi]GGF98132.1 heat-shock protein Hsp20 [Paenibacillus abyssi]
MMEGKEIPHPNPMKEWNTFHNQAGEVLGEEFWQDIAGLIPNTSPRIDIYYTSATVVVLVELPGLQSPDQIAILLEGQTLVMEGEIPRLYPVTDNRITQKERFFGSFRRSLPMPKPVSMIGIHAKYTQGLLTIELQIEREVQQTPIPIDFT